MGWAGGGHCPKPIPCCCWAAITCMSHHSCASIPRTDSTLHPEAKLVNVYGKSASSQHRKDWPNNARLRPSLPYAQGEDAVQIPAAVAAAGAGLPSSAKSSLMCITSNRQYSFPYPKEERLFKCKAHQHPQCIQTEGRLVKVCRIAKIPTMCPGGR